MEKTDVLIGGYDILAAPLLSVIKLFEINQG